MSNEIKKSSNRSFGIVFFIVFLFIGFYPFFNQEDLRLWALIISIVFLILGIMNSKILTPLNKIWFRFGILLGNFVSPIIMGIVFFIIVVPTSFVMKTRGKNLLNLKKNNKKSYWIKSSKIMSEMKNQF